MKSKIFLSLFLCVTVFYTNAENFIVAPKVNTKKMSKNNLKEKIGQEIRDSLHNCTKLTKKIGELQVELSSIQKQLFDKIEKLLDNKPPFKKAGRKELSDSFETIRTVRIALEKNSDDVKKLKLKINGDSCLKKGS